jgi:dihydroneopterin aldolase/2-amino-4-hydroxy-6-hydroxymethyldihydropteridine diphosphokinase
MEDAMDRIEIRGLTVVTVVGVLPHERDTAQPVEIDVDLYVDLHDAGGSDDLADTADYGDVAQQIAAVVRESKDHLLERLAERICEVALATSSVEAVDVALRKIRPPVAEVLGSTGVRMRRSKIANPAAPPGVHRAFLALGSNLGDRERYLRVAVDSLPGVVGASQVYETEPVGGPHGQGPYLNMVIEVHTELDPYALLRRCRLVEREALRQRVEHWGPRTLDIDVLFYDDIRIDDPELTIPHPRLHERRFVLAPLSELAPDRCPPGWDVELPPDGVHPRGALP